MGVSNAANKAKLHFYINVLEKGNSQEKQRKEGIFLSGSELPEKVPPFKDVVNKKKDHCVFLLIMLPCALHCCLVA